MTTVNITAENDADFYRVFQYQTVAGVPINITGTTMEMMLRRHAEDATAVMRLGTDTGEIVYTNAVQGLFSIMIKQIELQRLPLGDYDQSNIMTTGGLKTKLWSGTLTNQAGPTRGTI
jgi:hypothetical protein